MRRADAAIEGAKILLLKGTKYLSTAPKQPRTRVTNKDRVVTLSDFVAHYNREIIWRGHDGYICLLAKIRAFVLDRG
jgi:hypothetical protein